jgi:hypothetical protein
LPTYLDLADSVKPPSVLVKITLSTISLLASSAKTSGANEASANATLGGMLNYRTGKLDDGTDPTGWYEKD